MYTCFIDYTFRIITYRFWLQSPCFIPVLPDIIKFVREKFMDDTIRELSGKISSAIHWDEFEHCSSTIWYNVAKPSLSQAQFSLLAELALFPFKSDKLSLIRQISCRYYYQWYNVMISLFINICLSWKKYFKAPRFIYYHFLRTNP